MNRRGFLLGLTALMAAPAIVKAQNIMAVKQMVVPIRQRLIHAEIDTTFRTVHWYSNGREFVKWDSIDNSWILPEHLPKGNGDYFEQVDQKIMAAGEDPTSVPLVILPPSVHEPVEGLTDKSDLRFVSDYTSAAKVIRKRPWDLSQYGDAAIKKEVEVVNRVRKYHFENGIEHRWNS